jgi:glycine/D-amino acid oxidase-like deaminating enzyme/nitrite reductase/ring-hydroxylating ferredoxin subunit
VTAFGAPASLWQATLTPFDVAAEPRPDRAEVAVVGGGLAGVATALLLARAGVAVVLVEADRIGSRTTGNTTAKVSALQGSVYSAIRRHNGDDAVRDYAAATLDARAWLLDELSGADENTLEERPALTYATTDDGIDTLTQEADALALAGIDATWCAPGTVDLPVDVRGALRLDGQHQIQPLTTLHTLANRARSAGARIVERARVRDLTTQRDGVTLHLDDGDLRADRVVLATGLPILDRGLFFAHMVPTRQYVGAFRVPGGAPVMPMSLSVDPVERSLRDARARDGERLIVAGGNSFTTGREDDTAHRLTELVDWLGAHVAGATLETWWAAQDYQPEHHLPFAGAVPRTSDRVYAATGFAKWGMTGAMLAARIIAAEVTATSMPWSSTFHGRRGSVRTLASIAGANAAVAKEMMAGWARPEPAAESAPPVERDGLVPVAQSAGDSGCAMRTVCTHLGGVLRWNTAEESWDCPLHGSRFDADGRVIEGPATRDLSRD